MHPWLDLHQHLQVKKLFTTRQTTRSPAWPLTSSRICVLQEFKNVDGEEYHAEMPTLASPASQGSPDVYILPLTEVSLPVAKQPARSGESVSTAVQSSLTSSVQTDPPVASAA